MSEVWNDRRLVYLGTLIPGEDMPLDGTLYERVFAIGEAGWVDGDVDALAVNEAQFDPGKPVRLYGVPRDQGPPP